MYEECDNLWNNCALDGTVTFIPNVGKHYPSDTSSRPRRRILLITVRKAIQSEVQPRLRSECAAERAAYRRLMITDTPEKEVPLSVRVQFQYCAAALEWFYRGFPRECALVRCAQIEGSKLLLHVKFLSDSNYFALQFAAVASKQCSRINSKDKFALCGINHPYLWWNLGVIQGDIKSSLNSCNQTD